MPVCTEVAGKADELLGTTALPYLGTSPESDTLSGVPTVT